ncbi:MAG: ABC transporter permease [Pygmaiobacter massiliensis]|nr:ABC transporter permease [Pygmaiobacter massiliensis]
MAKLKPYLQDFWRYRYLLKNLTSRDVKVKYRRSALGIIWSVLNPLLMMMVLYVVFSQIFHTMQLNRGEVEVNFAVYLLTGQLIYNFFSEATQTAMGSVLYNAPLIKKVYVPKYIFPLEKVTFSLVNALFSLIALVIVLAVTRTPIHPSVLLFWVPMAILYVFNFGVGLILAAATVFFRDIMHLYGVLVTALMYLTPIMYDVDILPEWAKAIIPYNPLYWFVSMFRGFVIYGEMPSLNCWIGTCLPSVLVLLVGLIVFKKSQDRFVLYI